MKPWQAEGQIKKKRAGVWCLQLPDFSSVPRRHSCDSLSPVVLCRTEDGDAGIHRKGRQVTQREPGNRGSITCMGSPSR